MRKKNEVTIDLIAILAMISEASEVENIKMHVERTRYVSSDVC